MSIPEEDWLQGCNACSLKELCVPKLMRAKKVSDYLARAMEGPS